MVEDATDPPPAIDVDPASDPASDLGARIDAAITRIDTAVAVRTASADALSRRHAALKARMVEAVKALDDVITRGPAD